MPITPAPPYPKSPGDPILSTDWNQAVDEVIRLDNDKVNRAGDTITGNLTVTGSLGVGSAAVPQAPLDVNGAIRLSGPPISTVLFFNTNESGTPTGATEGFRIRYDENFFGANQDALVIEKTDINAPDPDGGIAFVNTGNDGVVETAFTIRGDGNAEFTGALTVQGNTALQGNLTVQGNTALQGNLTVQEDLFLPKTAGGSARFTHDTFNNEASLSDNNLKLTMGNRPFLAIVPPYEFIVGHTSTLFSLSPGGRLTVVTNFVRSFAVNQAGNVFVRGNLTVSGSKGGYVVDLFINRAGDTLEQGDVVVISRQQRLKRFSGLGNNIPIPEVDLTSRVNDTRVCGIVAEMITEQDLPQEEEEEIDPQLRAEIEKKLKSGELTLEDLAAGRGLEDLIDLPRSRRLKIRGNLLKQFVPKAEAGLDQTKVKDRQIGKMVTLGCYAHCKVDAGVSPIQAGDLLTTSRTRGHAQKVLNPNRATTGTIIGKALAPLRRGKGKIPVLVMLQ